MSNHTDPSIISIITSIEALDAAYTNLCNALIEELKGMFEKFIPFPNAVQATVISIKEKIARYPGSLDYKEFSIGAIRLLDPSWRNTHPIIVELIQEMIQEMVTETLKETIGIGTSATSASIRTKSHNGVYISIGVNLQTCSPPQWKPISEPFFAIALMMGVWIPGHPYPNYPEPVNIPPGT